MKYLSLLILTFVGTLLSQFSMAQETTTQLLVLIDSDQGGTYTLAKEIAQGIERWPGAKATIKKVKESQHPALASIPLVQVEELSNYDGIAFGSPVYFGNISTGMSAFFTQTIDLWTQRALEEMPATVFMSGGSGAANELALQSFWNTLSVHGMVLIPNGIQGFETIDRTKTQGNSVLGITSPTSIDKGNRPTKEERLLAQNQGEKLARIAQKLKGIRSVEPLTQTQESAIDFDQLLKDKKIELPQLPKPVGNYELYVRSGNLVFINQVALKDGKIFNPGKLGMDVTEEQVKEATKVTMLNVLAILKEAVGGDLNKVQRCVQLIGAFNTVDTYTQHAALMNPASDLVVEVLDEKGKHTRNIGGASSLPLGSSVSIQAVFEVE
ncbi:Atu1372/SO_1960 family protein [Myroides sp. DW712]|uniref:Atu1372/SO_1960 family protein n=1 Tax=Myroides sp. DW712 TaxID=3389800 RepID=UPI00397BC1B6